MDDKAGSAPRRSRDGATGLPGDFTNQDRVTVSSLEHKVRRRSNSAYYSTARSRKHRIKEESGSGLILWLIIIVVVFIYFGLLSLDIYKKRNASRNSRGAPAKTAVNTNQAAKAPPAEVKPAAPAAPAAGTASSSVPIFETITSLRRAQQLAEEGRRLVRSRNYLQAQPKLAEAATLAPNVLPILMDLAQVHRELKQLPACRDVLVRAIGIDPESVPARLMLAQVYYELRQNDDALAMAQWLLSTEAYSEEANQIAAEIYTSIERYDLAIVHWQKIASLNGNNAAVKNSLGAAQLKLGQLSQAINTFENLLKLDPDNSQAHYYLAICMIQKNEPELAVDVLAKASASLGAQFVQAWTQSADFDAVRGLPSFKELFPDSAPIAEASPAEAE